jgi:hypothetical protein
MLTGQVPHRAETPLATVLKRINEPLTPPRALNPEISAEVEAILLTALAADPEQRYQSAGDLATALRAALAEEPGQEMAASEATILSTAPSAGQSQKEVDATGQADEAVSPVRSRFPTSLEIALLIILGVVSACGLGGIFLSFLPNTETGELNLAMLPTCLGMVVAGFSSMGLIWLRKRNVPASAWLAIGVLAWFVGVNILGWGGFAVLNPGDTPFVENLGFSMALCFVPGGFLTLLGLGLYLYDRRRDRGANLVHRPAVSTERKSRYEDKLERAAEYRLHITKLIKEKKDSALARQLRPIGDKLTAWETHLHQLVHRLDAFERNHIIQRDLQEVPAAIADLEDRLKTETNSDIRAEMAETLARHRSHQEQLNALVTMMRRTELDIDETMAAIGAIYSQLQLLGAREIDRARAKRLSADVEEQADRLGDLLSAMDEVYEVT